MGLNSEYTRYVFYGNLPNHRHVPAATLGSFFFTLTLYDSIVPAPSELSMYVLVLLHHLCAVQIPPGHNRWN